MRVTVKQLCVLVLLAGQTPGTATAFTAEGHRVVGLIAESYLCPEARAYIAPLLEGNSLANAGVWADSIRDDPAWAYTRAWHFINVDDGQSMASAMAASPANVLSAMAKAERDLARRDLPLEKRAQALRFLVHFVADIHQPLHVGRVGDRGGNDLEVRWGEAVMSLHELWDGRAVLRAEGLATGDLATAIGALAVGQEAGWQASSPVDWAEESRRYRPLVYALPGRPGQRPQLDARYVTMTRNVVSLRLAQAGVRLAGRLNRLACPGGAATAAGSNR